MNKICPNCGTVVEIGGERTTHYYWCPTCQKAVDPITILKQGRVIFNGEVSSVKIENIQEKSISPLFTDASEITGIWDFLDGVAPEEHIRRLRE